MFFNQQQNTSNQVTVDTYYIVSYILQRVFDLTVNREIPIAR
jgi:hypothetical protein